jgi:hypothetical protein
LALSIRYSRPPEALASTLSSNARLTQCDETLNCMTIAYGAVLGMLVQGHPLDEALSDKLMQLVGKGELPYQRRTFF